MMPKDEDSVNARREKFLEILAANKGDVMKAALAVGFPNTVALTRARKSDPDFARKWDEAVEASNHAIESVILDRAMVGVEETVFYQGEPVGVQHKPSDTLALAVAKARMPEKYAPPERRKVEIDGQIAHTHKVGVAIIPMRVTNANDWEQMAIAHHTAMLPAPVKKE